MKPPQTVFQKTLRYILPRKCAITSEKMRHYFRENALEMLMDLTISIFGTLSLND